MTLSKVVGDLQRLGIKSSLLKHLVNHSDPGRIWEGDDT